MKMEKGFKCPRYLKRWEGLDGEERKIMMRANATYVSQHREALKRKNKDDKDKT